MQKLSRAWEGKNFSIYMNDISNDLLARNINLSGYFSLNFCTGIALQLYFVCFGVSFDLSEEDIKVAEEAEEVDEKKDEDKAE